MLTKKEFIKEFTHDYVSLNDDELSEKYHKKIPEDILVQFIVDYILENNLQNDFIDKEFRGDFSDRQNVTYLMKKGLFCYETFFSERGFKHWSKTHFSLKKALFSLIDSRFNQLMHAAPDSIINGNYELPKLVRYIVSLYSKSDK